MKGGLFRYQRRDKLKPKESTWCGTWLEFLLGSRKGWGGVGRQPLVHLGFITETFRVECVLTAPSSWCNFLHSFSFFLKSSDVAFLFLLLSLAKSFLFIISASLLTAWIFIVLSIASCFFIFSVAPSFSLLMSLVFSRSRKKNGKNIRWSLKNETIALLLSIPMLLTLFVTEEVIWRIKLSQNMHGYRTSSPSSSSGIARQAKYTNAHKKRHLLERWLAGQERIWDLRSDFSDSLFWWLSSETKPQSSRVLKVTGGFKTSHARSPRKS